MGELIARSEADLLDIRNFGAKSIDEVKAQARRAWAWRSRTARPGSTRRTVVHDFGDDDDQGFAEDEQSDRRRPRRARDRPTSDAEENDSMPTPTKGPRLGGGPAHERLMLANLATALFEHGRITTTEAKAKRLRPLAERLITFAKRGDLHARRRVLTVVRDKGVVHELFTEIASALRRAAPAATPASPRSVRARATTPRWR